MVIFLVGLVSMILMRTLRKDYARYSKEEEMDDMVSFYWLSGLLWSTLFFPECRIVSKISFFVHQVMDSVQDFCFLFQVRSFWSYAPVTETLWCPSTFLKFFLILHFVTVCHQDRDLGDEYGWKQVHGDVFRPSSHPLIFSSLIGSGCQIFSVSLIVIIVAMVEDLYTEWVIGSWLPGCDLLL